MSAVKRASRESGIFGRVPSGNFYRSLVAALFTLFFYPHHGAAAEYLVKTQSAYRKALNKVKPGDAIVLADGVWNDFAILFTAHGKADKTIKLRAQSPGRVILSGRSSLRIAGSNLVIENLVFRNGYSPRDEVIAFRTDKRNVARNVTLSGIVIDHFDKTDAREKDHWVGLYGRDNRIVRCAFIGKSNLGPTVVVHPESAGGGPNRHLIEHNYFGMRPELGINGGETIRIGTSKYARLRSETVVRQNYFEHADGDAEIISVKSGFNSITENVFVESRGSVVLRHGDNNVVSRNLFFGNGIPDTGGVRVINENQVVTDNYFQDLRGTSFHAALAVMNGVPNSPANRYRQVRNATISNNTFVNVSQIGFGVGRDEERSLPPVSTAFEHNVIVSDKDNPVRFFDRHAVVAFDDNRITSAMPVGGKERTAALVLSLSANAPEPQKASIEPASSRGEGAPADLRPISRDDTGPDFYPKPSTTFALAAETCPQSRNNASTCS